MPIREQRDPYGWAAQYAQQQGTAAQNERNLSQQALLRVFEEEAARQRPLVDLPIDLAKRQLTIDQNMRNMVPAEVGIGKQRRYGKDGEEKKPTEKAKEQAASEENLQDQGTEYDTYTYNGKEYRIPKQKKKDD